ncbi:MAG: FIST C-terminal domain-containing protein [Acidimicrobiia bacterium]|nr:FIST C-terminal domain-containing protein [Acidimicrobiia bacterium]
MKGARGVVTAAAALSEHPLATHAVGDAVGDILDQLDGRPDLATVFVTGNHAGALEDIASTVRTVLRPRVLVGAAATAVLGGHREVEQQPGVAVWAARCAEVTPVRIRTARMDDGWSVSGLPQLAADGERVLVLLADPHSFPTEGFLRELSVTCPDLKVVGGLTSGTLGPGGSRLVLDDEQHTSGAVGVLLDRGADVATVVSQGCIPIGEPFVVTHADRNHILELGGRPAIDRLRDLLGELSPTDRASAARSLQVGVVVDESRATFGPGDFMVRAVMGVDSGTGAVGIGEIIEVGQTVQFHMRDPATAGDDLRRALDGTTAAGALVFTCTGRGSAMFGFPDHDADVISTYLDTRATSGLFVAGEIGPVHGRSLLHGFSTSMALFGPRGGAR